MRTHTLLIAAALLVGSAMPAVAQSPAELMAMFGGGPYPTGKMPELADSRPWFNAKPIPSADLKGKVVLIDFWAYDCPGCQQDLPNVVALEKKYHDKGVQVIAVQPAVASFATDTAGVYEWIKKGPITYPIVFDSTGKIAEAFHNNMYPNRFFIDKQGMIRNMGSKSTEEALDELLAEKSDPAAVTSNK